MDIEEYQDRQDETVTVGMQQSAYHGELSAPMISSGRYAVDHSRPNFAVAVRAGRRLRRRPRPRLTRPSGDEIMFLESSQGRRARGGARSAQDSGPASSQGTIPSSTTSMRPNISKRARIRPNVWTVVGAGLTRTAPVWSTLRPFGEGDMIVSARSRRSTKENFTASPYILVRQGDGHTETAWSRNQGHHVDARASRWIFGSQLAGRATGRSRAISLLGRPDSRVGKRRSNFPRVDILISFADGEGLHRHSDQAQSRRSERRLDHARRRPRLLVRIGSNPFAQVHYQFKNRDLVRQPLPRRLHRRVHQTRGWFYTLRHATALFDRPAFWHVSHGIVLGDDEAEDVEVPSQLPDVSRCSPGTAPI